MSGHPSLQETYSFITNIVEKRYIKECLRNLISGKVTVVEEIEAQCNVSQAGRNYYTL